MEGREELCETLTWTDQRLEFALPWAVLTERAGRWATDRIAAAEATPTSAGRELRVVWSTVWRHVERHARVRVETPERVGEVAQIGFDETVMSPAERHRRRRFVSSPVDVQTGQIIDVFDGRDAADLQRWLDKQPVGGSRGSRSCRSIRTRATAQRSSAIRCSATSRSRSTGSTSCVSPDRPSRDAANASSKPPSTAAVVSCVRSRRGCGTRGCSLGLAIGGCRYRLPGAQPDRRADDRCRGVAASGGRWAALRPYCSPRLRSDEGECPGDFRRDLDRLGAGGCMSRSEVTSSRR